jgi:hypothetical protein
LHEFCFIFLSKKHMIWEILASFRRKSWRFFVKTNVMINSIAYVHKQAVFLV